MADLRLLVVAADPLARAGLATLLADRPGCQVVGQVSGDESLPDDLDVYRPDVLVWDLGWAPEESLDAMSEVWDEDEATGPGILALLADEELAPAAWSAGARGLLPRDVSPGRLLAALRSVAEGLVTVDPAFWSAVAFSQRLEEPPLAEELTPRETEVLQLMAEGLANRAIAQRLAISEHTVKFHVNAVMGKLGAQSRTAAVVRATRLGLILL